VGTLLMLIKSKSAVAAVSSAVYGGCMCVLFFASSLHHTVKRPASIHAQALLRRFDHISIYLMIAGSYTPICILSLDQKSGLPMLAVAWGLGLAGVRIRNLYSSKRP
jgi:hemolysin III